MKPSLLLYLLLLLILSRSVYSENPSPEKSPMGMDHTFSARPPENYKISGNDLLHIIVFREPDLETTTRINADGTLRFPLIGTIKIGGLTVAEATELITTKLGEDYLVSPHVTINVLDYSKRQYTILGPVRQPGIYSLPTNGTIDLIRAIAAAGGLTRSADSRNISVQRNVNGKETIYKLDFKDMQSGKAPIFEIQSGDTITVVETLF